MGWGLPVHSVAQWATSALDRAPQRAGAGHALDWTAHWWVGLKAEAG